MDRHFLLSGHTLKFDRPPLSGSTASIIIEAVGERGDIRLSAANKSLGALLDTLRRPQMAEKLFKSVQI